MKRLLLVAFAACGGSAPQKFADLARPAYGVQEHGVDTSSIVALDGNGAVWRGSFGIVGGSTFAHSRDATAAERTRVQTAFSALPADAGCGNTRTNLLQDDRSWVACADDAGTFVPPWGEAVDSVEALAR